MLEGAGFLPTLDVCVACGGEGLLAGVSAARGGAVCTQCLGDAAPLSPPALTALRDAARQPLSELGGAASSPAVAEGVRHAQQLYSYHTGLRLRSLRFARR
jgi:recombinational DNA repair protein (RecF pathway)